MNKLSPERRAEIISALVEGNSIRATCRMTGAAKGTVLKLLADVGEACAKFHAEHVADRVLWLEDGRLKEIDEQTLDPTAAKPA